jgi:hypothetical protein
MRAPWRLRHVRECRPKTTVPIVRNGSRAPGARRQRLSAPKPESARLGRTETLEAAGAGVLMRFQSPRGCGEQPLGVRPLRRFSSVAVVAADRPSNPWQGSARKGT